SEARIIFVDSEPSNWTLDPVRGQYYWHRFFHHQPDLNYDNPDVQDEMLRVLRFWLDVGLDGFRLDAVPYLYEREGSNGENLPETHEYLKRVRAEIDARYPDRVLLAEANQWPEDVVAYLGEGDGDECHMAFHFPVMPRMFMALRREDALPMIEILERTPPIPVNAQWGLFLRNHDELTLEMVTDEERDYMYAAYAKDPRMTLNLGIRRRLMPRPDNPRIFAHVRRYEDDIVLCVHNIARSAQAVELDLSAFKGLVPEEMFGRSRFPAVGDLPYLLTLGPRGFFWFQMRKADEG